MAVSQEALVGGKWRLGKKLGSGSWGDVFEGEHIETGERVAVKLEKQASGDLGITKEARIYRELSQRANSGVPKVHWHGLHGRTNAMVVEMLGKSLDDLFEAHSRAFSTKTLLMLAERMIARLQYVHSHGWLHRDIKPDNFMCGLGDDDTSIYVIDFGLAKKYTNQYGQHVPFKNGHKGVTGTVRYVSGNLHEGKEPSRRDGLESIGYVLAYFNLKGRLPWQGLPRNDKMAHYARIGDIKRNTLVPDLFRGLPQQVGSVFASYMSYCRTLEFADEPDYEGWRQRFRDALLAEGHVDDSMFDWVAARELTTVQLQSVPSRPDHVRLECHVDAALTHGACDDAEPAPRKPIMKRSRHFVSANGRVLRRPNAHEALANVEEGDGTNAHVGITITRAVPSSHCRQMFGNEENTHPGGWRLSGWLSGWLSGLALGRQSRSYNRLPGVLLQGI